jgi:hypothetical protein
VSNSATQINGSSNWATVQSSNGFVTLQASLSDPNAASAIQWRGGQAVPGQPSLRLVSTSAATNDVVTASVGTNKYTISVWVIWATLTNKLSGTLDPDDQAPLLVNGNWPTPTNFHIQLISNYNGLGGGNGLGPINCFTNQNLNYCYAVGRMETKAVPQPPGILNLIPSNHWEFFRQQASTWFDDGILTGHSGGSLPPKLVPDNSRDPVYFYFNTTNSEFFEIDPPGCPDLFGTNIAYTAECYIDFMNVLLVELGGKKYVCSPLNTYSYMSTINTNANPPSQTNLLSSKTIPLPTNSVYPIR